jgi:site-specific DNA recombinase
LVEKGFLPVGTGVGLYGYSWNKETKKREPIEYEVKIVEKIFTLLAEGHSRHKVSELLNANSIPTKAGGKWHPLTIQRMATHTAYIGETYFYQVTGSSKTALIKQPQDKWVSLPNVTPPIISRELFEQAQNQLRKSKEARQNQNTRHYLLRGHVYCGICGSPLVGHTMNRRYPYYVCRAIMPTSTKPKTCSARTIKAPLLENIVWDKVKSILSNPDIVMAEIKKQSEILKTKSNSGSFDKDIKCLQRQLKDYDTQEKHLVDALQMSVFTENIVLDKMNQLKHDRQTAINDLVEIQNIKQKLSTLEYAELQLPGLQDVINRIEHCSDDEKRLAFEALQIHVAATSEKIEIRGVIPIDVTTTQPSDKQDDVTHHCTNMGIMTCR